MTEQEYLESILSKYKVQDYQMSVVRDNREEVESHLRSEFGSKITNFYYSGSISKGTAISESFDVDLCVYFSADAFNTLQEMYDSVYDCLNRKYVLRKQRVSIGISYRNIDVVPGRKIDEEGNINLWDTKDITSRKTNVVLHKNYISQNGDRNVIKLLKVWKLKQGIAMKSFGLEILSIKALNNYDKGKTKLGPKLIHIFNYIKNADIQSMKLEDPANSNNDLMSGMGYYDRKLLQDKTVEGIDAKYWSDIIS